MYSPPGKLCILNDNDDIGKKKAKFVLSVECSFANVTLVLPKKLFHNYRNCCSLHGCHTWNYT